MALANGQPRVVRLLQTTRTPLGTAVDGRARSQVLWCSVGICEYAVACGRVILAATRRWR